APVPERVEPATARPSSIPATACPSSIPVVARPSDILATAYPPDIPATAYPPDIPEWTRRYEFERRESVSAARGLMFAFLFALAPLGLVVAGVTWIVSLFS
ncbi:MAG: hypothetical protein QM602_07445, partial [Microbacterium sp.]